MLNLLGCRLGAGDAGRGGDGNSVRVAAFQVERKGNRGAVLPGIRPSTRRPDGNVLHRRKGSGLQCVFEGGVRAGIGYTQAIVRQGFTVQCAEISK